jgi:CRP/FNR family transcriptional regulator, anaerobic regulatory protein
MIDSTQFDRITFAMPFLQRADENLKRELKQHAQFAKIPAGQDVFVDGDRVDDIALLLSGVVRVYKIGETGRAITLYRFGLGQSCILTANAILSQKSFPAIATVEEDAEAVMIPADVFREWVNKYDLWREFVFDLLSERLSTVMEVVDEVVFKRMDRRIVRLSVFWRHCNRRTRHRARCPRRGVPADSHRRFLPAVRAFQVQHIQRLIHR